MHAFTRFFAQLCILTQLTSTSADITTVKAIGIFQVWADAL